MKIQILQLILFSGVVLSGMFSGCSDSFLDGKPGKNGLVINHPDTIYLRAKASQNTVLKLDLPEAGNSQYELIQTPQWVSGSGYTSSFINGKTEIGFIVENSSLTLTGSLLLSIESLGIVRINLSVLPAETPVPNSMGHIPVEGVISDVRYNKLANCLYIATQNPNRLLIVSESFGMKQQELPRSPLCLAVSEDGKTVVTGHGGSITQVDVASVVGASATPAIKQYNVDGEVYSLALGENGYCYFSLNGEYRFHYLNLETGASGSEYFSEIFSSQIYLTKVTGRPAILAGSNSNAISMVNIDKPVPDQCNRWSLDFFTGVRIWTTEDGQFTVFNEGQIIQTPAFDAGNYIYTVARMGSSDRYCLWVDHCAATRRFYAVETPRSGQGETTVTSYLDNGTYRAESTYEYSEYVVETNGSKSVYSNRAQYVFANKDGSRLYIVKNTLPEEKQNLWCIEKIKTN